MSLFHGNYTDFSTEKGYIEEVKRHNHKDDEIDRLAELENKMEMKKRKGNQLCWIVYNPASEYSYDIEDAMEDVRWMVYEIKRLQNENRHYKEFINEMKNQMISEFDIK